MKGKTWIPVFFTVAACSWMPHWTCHYYRLETGTSFVVGSWEFSVGDSLVAMGVYSLLIAGNILSVVYAAPRFASAIGSGIGHLSLALVHITRLLDPFRFEVFGYGWSTASSIREILIVLPVGAACLFVAFLVSREKPGANF